MKKNLKRFLPPNLVWLLKKIPFINPGPYWSGHYPNWQVALQKSKGYGTTEIVEKVKNSLLKVKNGEAEYERDSVLFDEIQYSWPVLASLLWVYAQQSKLNLVDFGGSLGSTYFQNRKFLKALKNLQWNIVEQKTFTDVGIQYFQTEQLKFYHDVQSCLKENNSNCLLLSSVLPYVSEPYKLLATLLEHNFPFIVLDKMPFIEGENDRLTIQTVPRSIYSASYPAWFFSETKFKKFMNDHYTIVEEFIDNEETNIRSVYKGMVLKAKLE